MVVRSGGRAETRGSAMMANIVETIREKCIKGKRVELLEEVKRALAEGIDAKTVMNEALQMLKPHLAQGTYESKAKVLIGIGRAPVTQKFADEIGADFYGSDAHGAVEKCNQLLN
jgi:5-methyltetrahydrofolate--homocysteine methyltransferase